jgi:hypothetical protein
MTARQSWAITRHEEWTKTMQRSHTVTPATTDSDALDALALLLSGEEWNADTLDAIADTLRGTGRTIADYPLPPAEIRRVTYGGHPATFEQPAEGAELVIVCPLVGRETDATVWDYGNAKCHGDTRHAPHDVEVLDPNEPDDDLAIETALDEWKGITP